MTDFDPTLLVRLSRYLTSELLDELPNSDSVTMSSQRLGSLHKTLSSFLPSYIASQEDLLTSDYGNLSFGTFLFADVSGFTALSEALMQRAGPEGIEVLTGVFNRYFATMLEILAKSDGELMKFAGDALLSFFAYKENSGKDEFPKAVKTALRMQRAMKEQFQPILDSSLLTFFIDDFDANAFRDDAEYQTSCAAYMIDIGLELTMSIGVSRGTLFEALVGNISQRDHMIMGSLPGEADAAEGAGVRDDVIINEALYKQYHDQFTTKPIGDGFYQIIDDFEDELGDYEFSMPRRRRGKSAYLFAFDEKGQLEHLENELVRVEKISRFVSPEIVNKLVVRGDRIESENRLATVIFAHFTGFAELLDLWGKDNYPSIAVLLSQFYSIMQRTIATHGGVLTRSDPYSLGSKLLITFGAPVAHPDDPERAVETGIEMLKNLEIYNDRLREQIPGLAEHFPLIEMRMGITQGDVFAGEVGWRQRREYTVMGDDVNLAARLMSKADFGEIRISEAVQEVVQEAYMLETLEPFVAKGKSKPVQSYAVISKKRLDITRTSDTAFIGRDIPLMSLNMSLRQANKNGKFRLVGLHGDIGSGKSRLAKHFAMSAENSGARVVWVTSSAQNDRKTLWASIIAQMLDLDGIDDLDERKERLQEALDDLDLPEVKDVFDTLWRKNEGKKTSRRRQRSQTTTDIFSRLSSEQTLAMKKNDLAQFRRDLQDRLAANNARGGLNSWTELELSMSFTEAIVRFFETYTQEQPVLIVIDDGHKENGRALNILRRVSQEIGQARMMILLIYNTGSEPNFQMHKIMLSDLPEDQTYLLACAYLSCSQLGDNLSNFLWTSTRGRAIYVESLLQDLVENDNLIEDQGIVDLRPDADLDSVPDDIRGLVISRVDRLSSELRDIVRAAAVSQETFSVEDLLAVAGNEYENLHTVVDELAEAEIFENVQESIYQFKHGVVKQAVYEELTLAQRADLHRKLAMHFRRTADKENHVFSAAYHFGAIGADGEAFDLLLSHAESAEEHEDYDRAIALYSLAANIDPKNKFVRAKLRTLQI